MNHTHTGWISVPLGQFNRYLAASNPIRDNWSDGELLYEYQGSEKVILGFVTLTGYCLVPPETYQKFFS